MSVANTQVVTRLAFLLAALPYMLATGIVVSAFWSAGTALGVALAFLTVVVSMAVAHYIASRTRRYHGFW